MVSAAHVAPRAALAVTLAAAAIALPGAARAQAAPQAEKLFLEARAAIDRGDWAGGCPKLEESLRLVERPGTWLNLAECAAHDKKPALAIERLDRALAILDKSDERVAFAKKRRADLEREAARLAVTLGEGVGPDAKIELDGKPAARASIGSLLVDPGRHVITAVSPSGERAEVAVTVAAGERRAVTLAQKAAQAPTDKPVEAPPPAAAAGSGRRTAGFVLIGVGAAGAAGAVATGALILSRKSKIDAACPSKVCTPEGRSLIDGSKSLFIANGVAWGVGIAALAAGTVLVVTAPKSGGETRVALSPSPFGAGISLERDF